MSVAEKNHANSSSTQKEPLLFFSLSFQAETEWKKIFYKDWQQNDVTASIISIYVSLALLIHLPSRPAGNNNLILIPPEAVDLAS